MTESQEASFIKMAVARGLLTQELAKELYHSAREQKRPVDELLVERGILTTYNLEILHRDHTKAKAPRVIGGCEIVSKLGQGGMGAVYRAIQLSIGREVALKVLAPEVARKPGFAERFLREGKAMGAISHPNVITCFDAGPDGKILYMALELMTGGDADQAARRQGGRLPPLRACEIIRDCAAGLSAIARAGLIHRDIKPANIFLGEGGIAKLADLGLARHEDGEDQMTRTGTAMGTPAYMSPEQAQGEELDIRSDIYALGATLFALVTGQPPFTGPSAFAIVAKVINDPLPDPRALNPEIPEPVVTLIRHTMQKDRRKRPQTPTELLHDLNTCIEQLRRSGAGLIAHQTVDTIPTVGSSNLQANIADSTHSGRRRREEHSTTVAIPRSWLVLGITFTLGLIATLAVVVARKTTNDDLGAPASSPAQASAPVVSVPLVEPKSVTPTPPPKQSPTSSWLPNADGSWPQASEWMWHAKNVSAQEQIKAVVVALKILNHVDNLELGNQADLTGKKVREIVLPGEGITDLRPLRAFKSLQSLSITSGTAEYRLPLFDLSPLDDTYLALFIIHIPYASISDLTPLQNKPIADADFAGCPIRNIRPVLSANLRKLVFNFTTVDTGIEELRKLPDVTHIGSAWPDLLPVKEFWAMYDNAHYPGSRPDKLRSPTLDATVASTAEPTTAVTIQAAEPIFDTSPWILSVPKLAPYKIQQAAKKFNELTTEQWQTLLKKRRDLGQKPSEALAQDLKREEAASFKDNSHQAVVAAIALAQRNLQLGASPAKDPAFTSKLLPPSSAAACHVWRNACLESDQQVSAKVEEYRVIALTSLKNLPFDRGQILNDVMHQLEAMAPAQKIELPPQWVDVGLPNGDFQSNLSTRPVAWIGRLDGITQIGEGNERCLRLEWQRAGQEPRSVRQTILLDNRWRLINVATQLRFYKKPFPVPEVDAFGGLKLTLEDPNTKQPQIVRTISWPENSDPGKWLNANLALEIPPGYRKLTCECVLSGFPIILDIGAIKLTAQIGQR